MYDSILVPLDGSRRAEAVLPYAIDLAKRYEAKVVVMRVVPAFYQIWRETVPGTVDIAPSGAQAGVEIAQREVRNRARAARRYLSGVRTRLMNAGLSNVHTVTAQGDAGAEIVRYAKEEQMGLVAIATHGRSGLVRAVMGSVADRVIRQAPGPVLVIRSGKGKS
ncbi:MAG: universal stress protein [Dehalococcoidia bacterium]|nr:universal stress protein [Dehalococcoidia bacterium]